MLSYEQNNNDIDAVEEDKKKASMHVGYMYDYSLFYSCNF